MPLWKRSCALLIVQAKSQSHSQNIQTGHQVGCLGLLTEFRYDIPSLSGDQRAVRHSNLFHKWHGCQGDVGRCRHWSKRAATETKGSFSSLSVASRSLITAAKASQ